ncbi:pyridoxal phosphate-dependent transferase [Morchella snyderi]|nr:pyridoxal phosphate-dependent transferase [Morchella snyderi]
MEEPNNTMPALLGSHLSRSLRAFQIYGANTNVGKTIFSTILAKASRKHFPAENVFYLKPVSTGAPEDADDGHVARFTATDAVRAECLLQYKDPISPHLVAVEPPSDESLLETIRRRMATYCTAPSSPSTLLLETAGGVHSPTLSGTSQADLYRPLRLPVLLVADPRLGGISASISAFESLHIRGYDVEGVLLFGDAYYRNDGYLGEYFARRGIKTVVLPAPPERAEGDMASAERDREAMKDYYEVQCANEAVRDMLIELKSGHGRRIDRLEKMADEAVSKIWYPFTQHQSLAADAISAIDSAHGDFFQTYTKASEKDDVVLNPTFDGSGSWWTQGLGHANPDLTLAAAYAAGRYGHVMFANAIHEPGLELAKTLLESLSGGRLSRVFYSDNGSTGCEVAVKMGLRASRARYGWDHTQREAGVVGLKGSYHGDTIGVMDCAEPGVYNSEVEWYRGRGHWFDFPKVGMKKGRWIIEVPEEMRDDLGQDVMMESLSDIFDLQPRTNSELGKRYQRYILKTLERLTQAEGRRFGAVIIEPLILGAGGMLFSDPLFQHTLVSTIRANPALFSPAPAAAAAATPADANSWSGLPVIFDEVFTGMYRLGRLSSSSFLQTEADISVHAKLLTGGLLPLCATLASESVFEAFLSAEKKDALLHGHSYTAHAVGCNVARESVRTLMRMDERGDWEAAKQDWRQEKGPGKKEEEAEVWSTWTRAFVERVSFIGDVDSVWALGSVLAINLRAGDKAGYSSNAAQGFLQKMGSRASREWNVHARALGNVVYIMASQTTGVKTVEEMQEEILKALGA